ncbi:hypothetical protein M404DRAFT_1004622 [Pisolithus tinctorius Marx 270]|uniref:Uncharacterized protein n=1 Tax=Pisolithus tinctorius Marx 270 TaxID=870435 RepID=A0A0C3IRG5_PISTI|nr:hypothetical protein M404DRAFT_1004622 [Pisolithus tinctorius Marx 270]
MEPLAFEVGEVQTAFKSARPLYTTASLVPFKAKAKVKLMGGRGNSHGSTAMVKSLLMHYSFNGLFRDWCFPNKEHHAFRSGR